MTVMDLPNPVSIAQEAVGFVQRAGATGRNAAELVRYGGLRVDEEHSPFEIVQQHPMFRLRRYFPDEIPEGLPALVLVPPLMMMAEVFDVAPRSSSVRAIHGDGIDVWVVDFGRPEETEGGLDRDVADHILAVSEVVDTVRKVTGRDVVLGGYSQGGMFAYQVGAYRRNDGIDSIVTFGSPTDFLAAPLPVPISAQTYSTLAEALVRTGVFEKISLPGWFNRSATRMLDPIKNAQYQLSYLRQLHDREKLLPGEQQRQFLDKGGWTHYSGPAMQDLMRNAFITNRILQGGLVIGDHTVALADLELPILTVIGEIDKEGHPLSVRAINQAAPRAQIYELMLQTGHFGIVAGGGARRNTWPRVAEWIRWRAGQGELPDVIVPAAQGKPTRGWAPGTWSRRIQETTDLGLGVTRALYHSATGVTDTITSIARDRAQHLPLLNRIDALRPTTAVSLGLLLDEAAGRDPEGAFLLFGDRVLRHREVKHRVDSVVKGLIRIGVHPGDRVGVLMSSRPSAFSVLAAISRVGATAVLLRPDGDLAREVELAEVTTVISDPEHVSDPLPGVRWAVLGGGSGTRQLPDFVTDLEAIDPAAVPVPAWFRPNPTRAADVAFVLFIGTGEHTRTRVITNRRWVMSALGTASAATLKPTHTVYSTTPLYHSSALLMAVAGAVAAGSRLAFASAPDQDTFWSEVRRYGATHVSYTWTSLREITDGPAHPNEQHHPIQLFMGSGMPRGLWRRVTERFARAKVLEFYASTDGEAILANVSGVKVGAAGRPVPGTPRLKVVSYDFRAGRIAYGPDGFARECEPGEAGLLLARYDSDHPGRQVLRSVLSTDDSWQSTGDIFSKDADGDYWLVDMADWVIPSTDGPVAPSRVENALLRIPSVDMVAAYGVADPESGTVLVAAVTLFPGAELTAWDIESAVRGLKPVQRPRFVRVLDEIPLTTWSRVQWRPLAAQGLPRQDDGGTVWRLADDGSYQAL